MSSKRIVNASPLILPSKIGKLDLLRIGDVNVCAPAAILAEIGAKGAFDASALIIRNASWLTVVANPAIPVRCVL